MNILNRNKPTNDNPETYVPGALADLYPEALEHVREHVTAYTDRNWFENLSGGWLRNFLADAIATTKHDGIIPGTVSRPGIAHVERPVLVAGRRESTIMSELVPETLEAMSDARRAHWDAYRYSEEHEAEFTAEVVELEEQILSAPVRAWAAYQHLRALEIARGKAARAAQAERDEQQRLRIAQCPVCGDSDTAVIGQVETRRLIDGSNRGWPQKDVASLRSCHLCFEYAHDAYLARHAANSAGANRAELVAAALDEMDV